MKTYSILFVIGLFLYAPVIKAQDAETSNSPAGGSQSFLLTGSGSILYTVSKDENSFSPETLLLLPLAKINDRLFLEGGVKMEMQDNGDFAFGLEVLNLHYRINPWLTVHIGKFAAPWGNVLDLFGEGFVGRFPVSPIGLADDGMAPTDQVGFGFQGGIQTGNAKVLYDVYLANGPQLIVDEGSKEGNMTGHMDYGTLSDNNKNKAVGGKIGILPFSNSCLQVDAFGQYAGKTGDRGSAYENVASSSYGADFNFYKMFSSLLVRLMGQYETTNTQNVNYKMFNGIDTTNYTFNNKGDAWYLAGTIRPSGLQNKYVRNIEIGARYVDYTSPEEALWGGPPQHQLTFDLTYWFTWSSQINFGYNMISQSGTETSRQFVIRALYKF